AVAPARAWRRAHRWSCPLFARRSLRPAGFLLPVRGYRLRHRLREFPRPSRCSFTGIRHKVFRKFGLDRHPDVDPGALRDEFVVAEPDAPAMVFDDARDDGEAESYAILARRNIRLEHTVAIFQREAGSIVPHCH